MTEAIRKLIHEQANLFYDAQVSSVDAFRVINHACRSAWNYYDGIFTDAHREFERQVGNRIDADVDSWA